MLHVVNRCASGSRRLALLLAAGAAMSLSTPHADAQTVYSWNTGSGAWDTSTNNWLLLGVPAAWTDGLTSEASFGAFLTSGRAVTLGGGRTASGLSFAGLGGSFYSLSGSTISLANSLGNDYVNVAPLVLGGTTAAAAGGDTVSSGILFSSNLNLANNGVFGLTNLTLAGSIDRATTGGQIIASGTGNTVITGAIGASITGGIAKSGSGTLHLSGTNAFTGGINVAGGVLSFASDAALGDGSNSISLAGGTLRSTGTTTFGAARQISVAGNSRIDLSAGTTLNANGMSGNGALTVTTTGGTTTGTLVLNSASPAFTGQVQVGAPAAGQVGHILAQNTFVVNGSTVLALGGSASLANAAGITVGNGSQLQINQPTSAVLGRLGSVPLTFNSGRFQYNTNTNGNVPISETTGPVTATGVMVITATSTAGPGLGAAGTTITFPSLTRADHATLAFRPINVGGLATFGSGYSRFFLTGLPFSTGNGTTSRSIVPWATQTNSSLTTSATWSTLGTLMTYDSVLGFTALNTTTEAQTVSAVNGLAAVPTGVNVRLSGSNTTQTILTGGQTVNAIINSSSTITGASASDVLTVSSGAYVSTGLFTFNNATVNNPNGAYFHMGNATRVQGTSQLIGAGGVTAAALNPASGTAIDQLQFTNSPGNAFTGGLYINGNAGVTFTQNNQLGNDDERGAAAGAITLGGGQLILASASTVSLADGDPRPISVNASNGTIGTNIAGAVLQIPGPISGAGQLQFGGSVGAAATGVVELTNPAANTYTGGTIVAPGVLRIANANQLGSGSLILSGGTLQASANLSFGAAPTLAASSTIDTQANAVTLVAGINQSGGALGTGALSNVLTKTGSGTLTITGNSNAGALNVGAGSVIVNGSLTAVVASGPGVSVSSGATLGGSGTISISTAGASNQLSVLSGGTLSPGNSPGLLTLNGDVNLASGAIFKSEWNGPSAGIEYDVLAVNGSVSLSGSTLLYTVGYGNAPSALDKLFIIVNDGTDAISGTFASLPEGATVNLGIFSGVPYTASISYVGDSTTGTIGSGNDVVIYNVVPSSSVCGLVGGAGLWALRRRRR